MARDMKDSGIEWIGKIPSDWKVIKTLRVLTMPITDGPHETPELFDTGIPFVSAEAVSCGNGNIDFSHIRGYISKEYYDECCKKYIPQNDDILMIKSGATTGRIAMVNTDKLFAIWSPLGVFRCNQNIYNCHYMFFFLQSDAYQKQIENRWTYGTQQNIGMRTLEQLLLCFPSLPEQHRIADFLDRKCAEIDNVLEKTRASIEEYKKLKQSVITQAVTKGIRGERQMKNSGIEWIGEMPAEWNINVMFQIFKQVKNKNEGLIETNLLSLSYGKIKRKSIDTVGGLLPESFDSYNIIEKDDIVIRLTDLQNDHKSLRVGLSSERGIVTSAYVSVRNYSKNNAEYLYYYLHCYDVAKGFYGMGAGVRQGLNWDGLKNLQIITPSITEQNEICEYLDRKCSEIDTLISKKEQLITELEAYKKSLIYEYVTGKKEVASD